MSVLILALSVFQAYSDRKTPHWLFSCSTNKLISVFQLVIEKAFYLGIFNFRYCLFREDTREQHQAYEVHVMGNQIQATIQVSTNLPTIIFFLKEKRHNSRNKTFKKKKIENCHDKFNLAAIVWQISTNECSWSFPLSHSVCSVLGALPFISGKTLIGSETTS